MNNPDFFDTPYKPLEWEPPSHEDYLGPIDVPLLDWHEVSPIPDSEYLENPYDSQASYEAVFSPGYPDLASETPANTLEKNGAWKSPSHKALPDKTALENGRNRQRLLSGIAQALADTGRYRNIDGRLYQYRSPCWRLCQKDKAMELLFGEVQALLPDTVDDLPSDRFKEVFEQLRCRVDRENEEELRQDNQEYLCCQDAIVRLSDGRIFPPDPGLNLFYYINVSAEDIDTSDGYYTELFLENITNGENDLRRMVLQMVAAIITAMPLKKFFFLEGEGNTGKSQLIKFLEKLLGESACETLPDINELSEKYALGGLVNKLMCSCPDVPNEELKKKTISRIKEVAGDDRVSGKLKYVNKFQFDCYA